MTASTIDSQQETIAVPKNTLVELYRKMLTVYYVEERMKAFAKQGKCSFVASTRGHEMTQIGITLLPKPGHDWFFTYYRSKATAIGLGIPLKDVFLGMLGRQGDPNSGGRNMPEHFSSPELNYVAGTAGTGSQYLPAVGMAKGVELVGGDRIVYVESGEGATSEGEFFESLNWASREKLPILFCVQNNGYAIWRPSKFADCLIGAPDSGRLWPHNFRNGWRLHRIDFRHLTTSDQLRSARRWTSADPG